MLGKILNWLGKDSGSPSGEVNTQDAVNTLRTALIAGVSGGIVIFLQAVGTMDLGVWSPVAIPAIAAAIDYVRRIATDYSK